MPFLPRAQRLYSRKYKFELQMAQAPQDYSEDQAYASETFITHSTSVGRNLHILSEGLMKPAYFFIKSFSYFVRPSAGTKGNIFVNTLKKLGGLFSMVLSFPVALLTFPFGFGLRMISHTFRPMFSYMRGKDIEKALKHVSLQNSFEIMTHNLGFVPTFMSRAGNLRHPEDRARDQAQHVLKDNQLDLVQDDPSKRVAPAIIAYQETFNEPATKILCESLIKEYPYIIHSVAPHISGLNSGAMFASKYEPLEFAYYRFDHMLGPEQMAPRGISKVLFDTPNQLTCVYNFHTQAFLGKSRATARKLQLEFLHDMVEKDIEEDRRLNRQVNRIILGDTNSSAVNFLGENNLTPPGQAEESTLTVLKKFDDSFLKDHDPITGERTGGEARYLARDSVLTQAEYLQEPRATWYNSIFPSMPGWMKLGVRLERWRNGEPAPEPVAAVKRRFSIPPTWGTERFFYKQGADGAKFDVILGSKNNKHESTQEIRRAAMHKEVMSAASDHLPVQASYKRL